VGDELWPKVITVLNRGGRFQDFEKGYDGDRLRGGHKAQINLYQEKTAKTKSAMTGEPFPGIATYVPAPMDIMGRPIDDEAAGYDLRLITYREISHTKTRTVSNYWLLALLPENFVLMNRRDARKRGLAEGDRVRIRSATNAAMRVDPVLGNTCLSDPAGASAVFYDTYVTVTKV